MVATIFFFFFQISDWNMIITSIIIEIKGKTETKNWELVVKWFL